MKFFLITALCSVFLLPAMAQQSSLQQPPKTGSLSGIVTQYGSGEPVRGAEVSISREEPPGLNTSDEAVTQGITVTTDRNGRFQFPSLAAGAFSLTVRKGGFHGFRTQNSRTWQEILNLTLAPGQAISDLALAMQPGAVITGRVTDEAGEAMARVQVNAFKWVYANHHRQLRPTGGGSTDDNGGYRIFGLEPGRYIVRANAIAANGPTKMRYAPCYFPDATSPSDANTLTLRPGEQAVADLRMSRARVAKVSGHIANTGATLQTQVYLRSQQDEGSTITRGPSATVDENGNFTIDGVFPGDYLLGAFEFGGDNGESPRHAEFPIKVDGIDLKDVNLTLEDSGRASMQGTMRIDGDNARHPRFDSLRIGMLPAEDSAGNAEFIGQGGYAAVGRDGTIRLDKVAPGKYVVSITAEGSGWEDFYTKSVQIGGRDVTDSIVSFSANRGVVPISIAVGIDGAYVEGTVTDENNNPVANATVIGVPEQALRSQFDLYQRAGTDQTGHFRLRGIKPGTYSFYAWNTMEDESYMDPEFLARYESSRVDLSLNPKDHQTLHLTALSTDVE